MSFKKIFKNIKKIFKKKIMTLKFFDKMVKETHLFPKFSNKKVVLLAPSPPKSIFGALRLRVLAPVKVTLCKDSFK